MASSNQVPLRLDAVRLQPMASGHLCLCLSEQVTWEEFPSYADHLLQMLGGRKVESVDGVDLRIWDVVLGGTRIRLVFDDFPMMVSLESSDEAGDAALRRIELELLGTRSE